MSDFFIRVKVNGEMLWLSNVYNGWSKRKSKALGFDCFMAAKSYLEALRLPKTQKAEIVRDNKVIYTHA